MKEQYFAILSCWRDYLLSGGKPTASHMMLYNILRSKPWDRGFSPITRQIKLDNGHDEWLGTKLAAAGIGNAAKYGRGYLENILKPFRETTFGKIIDVEDIKRAWALIEKEEKLK